MALINGRILLSKLMLAMIAVGAVIAVPASAVDSADSAAAEAAAIKHLETDGNALDAEAAAFVNEQQNYQSQKSQMHNDNEMLAAEANGATSTIDSKAVASDIAGGTSASGAGAAGAVDSTGVSTADEKLMAHEAKDAAVADAISAAGVAAAVDSGSRSQSATLDAAALEAKADETSRRVLNKVEQGARHLTIERTFSVSHISVPQRCEERKFKTVCTRLVNYYARRFERDMVSQYSTMYNTSSDLFNREGFSFYRDRERGVQNVSMSMYSPPGDPVMTLFSIFNQHVPNNPEDILIVETINFDSRSGKFIPFEDLFENHELAAMLCARIIESKYKKYGSKLLPVVISATQLRPSNFIITAKGLRFFFAPGLVKPDSKSAESIFIKLDKLQAAKPNMKWWDGKRRVITAQQRDAVNNSKLKSVIDLDETDKQLKE